MSLEQSIGELARAVAALADALQRCDMRTVTPEPASPERAAPPPAPAPAPGPATLDDVKAAVKAMTARLGMVGGRQAAVDLLARYGCKKLPELHADRYADFIAEVNAL